LTAQTDYLQFDQLNNGLSTNIVNYIYQDKKGWMWFSTSQGLNQYDGNKIKIYKNNVGAKSLTGSLIRFIFEDSKGNLWVGTEIGGLNLFDRKTESFTCFYEKDKYNNNIIYSANTIAEDKTGTLWIGTSNGLKKLDRKTHRFTTIFKNNNDVNYLIDSNIRKLLFDNTGKLWIGTSNGLDCYNPKENKFFHQSIFDKKAKEQTICELYEDREGKIWIGTYTEGIYVYNPVSQKFENLIPNRSEIYSKTIRAIVQDNSGNIWIGTKNGLYLYSEVTKRYSHFVKDEKNPLGLCHNSVLSFCKDNKGDIWIGTRGGINYLINEKQVFRHYNSFPNDNKFLNNDDIYTFWLDKNNSIWIGTDFGGINILNQKNNTFQYINQESTNNRLTNNSIKAITDDGKGNLWIGTYQGGINVLNLKTKNITTYSHIPNSPNGISDTKIWAILRDHNNNMWIGTRKGVNFYDSEKKKFKNCKFTEKQVDWLAEDSENNLWIGTNPEIIIYNIPNNSIKKYSINTRTRGFYEDHLNRIWLATETKGIVLIDKRNGKIQKSFTEDQGLASNSTFTIIEDNSGALWTGTANGLSRILPDQNKVRSFYKEDGTNITHYNYGACYKLPSGELLFGGFNGFVIFDPKKVKDNAYLPPVILTDIKINNKPVPIGEKNSPLTKHISETKRIVLNHKQNFLTFEYVALNFCTPNHNRYKYKMEGIDNDWIKVGNKREAIYTDLNPGTYTFSVIASNNDNQWNQVGTSLIIEIIPPFYKTIVFKILLLILLALIIIYIIYIRTNRVKLINKELERQVFNKTIDLQQVAIQLEESQSEVMAQNEEIEKQNEFLRELNEKISLQNRALETYSNDLENKVKKRTIELELSKNKAEESEKLKSSILANMSHEIRTPMNSIIGLSNILLDEEITKDDKTFFTQNIKKNCDTLLHLINSVLDLSVIEAGKVALNKAPVNITHLLKEIHEVFELDKKWLDKSHIDFKLKIPADDLIITTDKVRVEQILRNLLHNAFKFTEKGSIELGYASSVNDLIFYVRDTGIGIPLAKQNIIFDSFVKLEENTQKTVGNNGVGLGLSICWRLSHILGGKLWVTSEVNEGSTFYFSLPQVNGEDKLS
jgi:ligand-binding sensor domain-containing protein/signal transduction histidine kinase